MSRTVQNAISAALNNPKPAKNFVTGDDARNIAAAAKSDGRVTAEEVKLVADLKLEPTFFNDDLFGGTRDWNFEKPTASGEGFGVISEFIRENSMKDAVQHALTGQGFQGYNFIDTKDAANIVRAAKADGKIDASEREQLETLKMGWSYYSDDLGNQERPFETPTVSIQAGPILNAALEENE